MMLIGKPGARRPRPLVDLRTPTPALAVDPRPLVAVLLGDGTHPFPRLLSWVADLAASGRVGGVGGVDVVAQHGTTPLPSALVGVAHLDGSELDGLLSRAWVVVTHGGAAEILASRTHGHRPVVVARLPELGEHGDDHQRRSVARFVERGLCVAASSRDSLRFEVGTVLEARGSHLPAPPVDPTAHQPSAGGAPWLP